MTPDTHPIIAKNQLSEVSAGLDTTISTARIIIAPSAAKKKRVARITPRRPGDGKQGVPAHSLLGSLLVTTTLVVRPRSPSGRGRQGRGRRRRSKLGLSDLASSSVVYDDLHPHLPRLALGAFLLLLPSAAVFHKPTIYARREARRTPVRE